MRANARGYQHHDWRIYGSTKKAPVNNIRPYREHVCWFDGNHLPPLFDVPGQERVRRTNDDGLSSPFQQIPPLTVIGESRGVDPSIDGPGESMERPVVSSERD